MNRRISLAALANLIFLGAFASAQSYKVLYKFAGGNDGAQPYAGLVQDSNGNLYGTSAGGGSACDCGTVFEIVKQTGQESVLHAFTGKPDGSFPVSALLFAGKSNQTNTFMKGGGHSRFGLYGTTYVGGANNEGTVFQVTLDGKESVLYSFQGLSDGWAPDGVLVLDAAGNLFGTALYAGPYPCFESFGCGTVFKVSASGEESTFYAFTGGTDDGNSRGGLILDAQGNFYGTTAQDEDAGPDGGTVFKLAPDGTHTTLLSFFDAIGRAPLGPVLRDQQGNLYGTTYVGGSQSCYNGIQPGCGVVFKLTPNGTEQVLYAFAGGADGGYPMAGLVADEQGNLYGTTYYGGNQSCFDQLSHGCGVVFKVAPDGTETVLYTFSGGSDGAYPMGGLVRDAQGNLYGTTVHGGIGGTTGLGVVFEISP